MTPSFRHGQQDRPILLFLFEHQPIKTDSIRYYLLPISKAIKSVFQNIHM